MIGSMLVKVSSALSTNQTVEELDEKQRSIQLESTAAARVLLHVGCEWVSVCHTHTTAPIAKTS